MHSDATTPVPPDDEAARLIQEGLDPVALPPSEREALLRRILERTGGKPPLAPVPQPKAD